MADALWTLSPGLRSYLSVQSTLIALMTAFTPCKLLLVSEKFSVMKSEVGSSAAAIFCPTLVFESRSRRG